MNKFPCTKCGCCCKRVRQVLASGVLFPYGYKEDGRCEKLTEDNKCSVYEDRPDICKIDVMARKSDMTYVAYMMLSVSMCNVMMDEDNINIKYRIK